LNVAVYMNIIGLKNLCNVAGLKSRCNVTSFYNTVWLVKFTVDWIFAVTFLVFIIPVNVITFATQHIAVINNHHTVPKK
jgi:hypothetical protein